MTSRLIRDWQWLLATFVFVASNVCAQSAIERHGKLSISDGSVVDAHGSPLSLAGPSLFWGNRDWGDRADYPPDSYYNAAVVEYVNQAWNAPIIRVAMGAETPGGYMEDPEGRWEKIVAVADAAIDRGMYVIVDWHSHHAEDHPQAAVQFFERVAHRYGDTPNLIYEIYNEPLPEADWKTVIRPYAETVIDAIRRIDSDNLIVVGTRSWSQDVDEAAADPIVGRGNIAYTLHFYAGTHRDELREKARAALDLGLPLMVTEWGSVDATGDGEVDVEETQRWMAFLRQHRLTHCNWSLHSKQEGASILTVDSAPDGDWNENNLTLSGRLVQDIVLGWHEHDYRRD